MNVPALHPIPSRALAPTNHPAPGLRSAPPAEQAAAVAAQFEAILVRQLLGPTITKLFGSEASTAGSVYGDMLPDTMATQLSSGPGLGLGRLIAQQLSPRDARAVPPVSADATAPAPDRD
jgi:peptidoglycan hydrolase FlgJ